MIKNVIIAVVGFAAGAVIGVAAASSYFRKNGCEKCQAKTEADIEDAYRKGLKDGSDDMIKANQLADEYRPSEINDVFEQKNEPFNQKNEVFERINKAFDRETSPLMFDQQSMHDVYHTLTSTAELLEDDRKNFIEITTREQFQADADDSYDRYMWTYWAKNNVVSNEFDGRVDKHEEYVGLAFAAIFATNPSVDTLYVRNDDKEAFYEIEKIDDTYMEGPIPDVLYGADVFYEEENSDKEDED